MANWTDTTPSQLLDAHLQRPKNTARAYATAIKTFRLYLTEIGEIPPGSVAKVAVETFVGMSRGSADRTRDNYIQWLRLRYPALNTVRCKVHSLMGLLKRAHKYDVIPWMLDPAKLPASAPIRDTRGPGREHVEAMLAICSERLDAKGARDEALLRLLAHRALRCNEALSLDVGHVDLRGRRIRLLGKGKIDREFHAITDRMAAAIRQWLEFRGKDAGPLFTSLDPRRSKTERLTYYGALSVVRKLGREVGIKLSPHKLRHHAATEALRQTGGDTTRAMAVTRHIHVDTLVVYNDAKNKRVREDMESLEEED